MSLKLPATPSFFSSDAKTIGVGETSIVTSIFYLVLVIALIWIFARLLKGVQGKTGKWGHLEVITNSVITAELKATSFIWHETEYLVVHNTHGVTLIDKISYKKPMHPPLSKKEDL